MSEVRKLKETITIHLKVDKKMYEELQALAEQDERTIVSLIRIAIKEKIKKEYSY